MYMMILRIGDSHMTDNHTHPHRQTQAGGLSVDTSLRPTHHTHGRMTAQHHSTHDTHARTLRTRGKNARVHTHVSTAYTHIPAGGNPIDERQHTKGLSLCTNEQSPNYD